jgi:hypothetical protein
MEGIDYSFEKDLFGKRNDIEDDTVIFQIYSDEKIDEIYIGRVASSFNVNKNIQTSYL